ncbi:MAG: hypothetical protein GY842_13095 [bacterium]|nr:hypothetical protein [bacterium]
MTTYSYWQDETDDAAMVDNLITTFDQICANQSWFDEELKQFTRLYLNREVTGFKPGEYVPMVAPDEVDGTVADGSDARRIMVWNLIKSGIDAAIAKIMMQPAVPWLRTENGKVKAARIGRLTEQYLRSILHSKRVFRTNTHSMRDAAIYPFGCTKTYVTTQRKRGKLRPQIWIDPIHPSRIRWDNQTSLDSNTQPTLYHVSWILRRDLRAKWPKFEERIDLAKEDCPSGECGGRDMIRVIDAYDMSVGERIGKRVIAIEGQILHKQDWPYEVGPFEFVRWQDDLLGSMGISAASDIEGIQEEMNNTLRMIKRNKNQYGDSFLYTNDDRLTIEELEGNETFKVLKGTSPNPPQVVTQPFVAHQMVEWAGVVRESGFEQLGVSQMAATGEKPAGLRSGKALLTFDDINSARFSNVHYQRQQLIVGESEQILRRSRELHKGEAPYDYQVKARAKKGFFYIKWGEVKDLEDYDISIHPGSALPHTPAAQAEFVGLRMQEGLIDRSEARLMVDWPDLAKFDRLANAPREQLMDQFERMLESNEYEAPDDHQELGGIDPETNQYIEGLGHMLAKQYYLRGKVDGIEEKTLALLDQWMEEAQQMVEEAAGIVREQEELLAAAQQPPPAPEIPGTLPASPEAAAQLAEATATMQPPAPVPGMEG